MTETPANLPRKAPLAQTMPEDRADLPPAPAGFDEGFTEATGLPPVVEFEQPGDYVAGWYRGMKDEQGPNKSRIYHLEIPGQGIVAVWGSTILDSRMNLLNPPFGSVLLIQYLGTVRTQRGLSPAKDFRVRVKRGGK